MNGHPKITVERWNQHWYRIRDDHKAAGALPTEAAALADIQTVEEFGPRPPEEGT